MKLSLALTTATLVAGALAAPRSGLARRLEARGILGRRSVPPSKMETLVGENGVLVKSDDGSAEVQYSKNWAGVVREQPPAASATYTQVSATFTVPLPTATDYSGDIQAASAWVGIDGDTYTNAILQTGVDAYVNSNGERAYDAWYEWYPNAAENFAIDLTAGDVIVATVKSTSPSKGVAIIENKSTGQSVTKSMSAPSSSTTLGGQNAEWIVEDFNSGSTMVPFANFGQIDFTGARAKTSQGDLGVQNATVLEIEQNGAVLAKVDVKSDSEFTVTYK
ncbi:Aspergillopepsin-2 [Penicillium diatomitis]|uniref:Aspergillopepsin-2 n=1 Tax=Penicillium diatomitis TaxID=2819901 RepID=A0A9W9X313_9EURO|nr:Aspergillopepsin-2 [Penicillium diatomitis]KAJ5481167.1 Aspergillopepsin-2 [Penicillium diatomitis]